MNLSQHFDFSYGITGFWSLAFTIILVLICMLFLNVIYQILIGSVFAKLKTSVVEILALVLAFITSSLLWAYISACEIDIDDYKDLHSKLELYTENKDVQHALKLAIADKKITKAEYSRLKQEFEEAQKNDARIVIEKYEKEIKDKVLKP